MKRGLVIGAACVLVTLLAGVLALLLTAGSIVRRLVERVGTDTAGTAVTLDSAQVSVTSGTGILRGLTVGNPPGFKSDYAIRLGEVEIVLDVSSLARDPILVKEVVVKAPHVNYEIGARGSNLEVLRRHVQGDGAGRRGRPGGGDDAPGARGTAGGRRLVIENLYIRDGRIQVSADFLRAGRAGAALPTIHLKNIGRDDGTARGASPGEVARQILVAISREAGSSVRQLDTGPLRGERLKGLFGR